MVYRLTAKAHDLYPMESNALVIDLLGAAQELFGGVAAEKLLYASFRKRVEYYERKVKGEDVVKRAKMLAKAREQEGYLCDVNEEGMELFCPFVGLTMTSGSTRPVGRTICSTTWLDTRSS